uniref:Uncharacterized protein n=1 Tax=Electrophorus electricus TaxID=8005 RepID=A0AAY5E9K6_ELEEL
MKTLLIRFLILAFGVWNKSPKHRSKRTLRCVCVLWCFDSNLECHLKFEVWNSFLILSCLSVMLTSVHAHDKQSLIELQDLLKRNKPKIIVRPHVYHMTALMTVVKITLTVLMTIVKITLCFNDRRKDHAYSTLMTIVKITLTLL